MTNKEAVKCLYDARGGNVQEKFFEEAFNMAIKALEQLDDYCVYRIESTDSYQETTREISNLVFSSYENAEQYRSENGLQNGWWSIEAIKPL